MNNKYSRPFLKWPGCKYQILPRILARLPKGQHLIEPFVGSGVVGLNADFEHYTFADINPDLIGVYRCLQDNGEEFLKAASQYFHPKNNTAKAYYRYRDVFNTSSDVMERAIIFIYLNRHGYNGLCRYNSKGFYNVPFGRYRNPELPINAFKHFLSKVNRISLHCEDFATVMQRATAGCVIYCDPPYVPLSETAHFTKYARYNFDDEAQIRLAKTAEVLAQQKIPVLISNHDTEFTRALYQKAECESFLVKRWISCRADQREPVAEILAVYD